MLECVTGSLKTDHFTQIVNCRCVYRMQLCTSRPNFQHLCSWSDYRLLHCIVSFLLKKWWGVGVPVISGQDQINECALEPISPQPKKRLTQGGGRAGPAGLVTARPKSPLNLHICMCSLVIVTTITSEHICNCDWIVALSTQYNVVTI